MADDIINPTKEQLDEAFKNLVNFRNGIRYRYATTIPNSKKDIDRAYYALCHAFSYHECQSRINYISALLYEKVDILTKGSRGVDREDVKWFQKYTGDTIGGVTSIFNSLYDNLWKSGTSGIIVQLTLKQFGKIFKE